MLKCDYLIVGAGFAGVVLAERIANNLNKNVIIIDKRNHIGGNAYDMYDKFGILIHKYGPHIFHTNDTKVFNYLSSFTNWRKYEHVVKAYYKNEFFDIPVNANTLEKFYKVRFSDINEIKKYFKKISVNTLHTENSEDIIISGIGREMYEAFFEKFTEKTWFKKPSELSASVCGRIKVKYNYDEKYFQDKYQFMPADGYLQMFNNLLQSGKIKIFTDTDFSTFYQKCDYRYLIYTGAIDEYYKYKYGKLPYRSLITKFKNYNKEKYQKYPVINYTGDEPFSRITEFKYITGQNINKTTIGIEYPVRDGEKFYPILTKDSVRIFNKYDKDAKKEKNILFTGRLASYKYYNMDQVVAQSLQLYYKLIK